ncbi:MULTISPECIES: DUF4198 domain-containing protein [Hyphobacterium]|uniref:DUF4198 domain-containing protein n=1 Tax=Hyphobacterium vulgare TaxID=1736751 RepID=A0ABV6ZW31_9PROT|nr:DUF4198 domain-containing protein [Hyphobacterium sp. SN044]
MFHSCKLWIRTVTAALVATMLTAPLASAHKTYLATERTVWEAGSEVTVGLTSALEFPDIETGPARNRIDFTSVRVGHDEVVEDLTYEETPTALRVSFTPQSTGFASVAISALPRSGEIAPEDVALYFDEIGADAVTRAAFDALPGDPAMMRSYTKHTKIFLCVETCESGADMAAVPVGQALEFVAGQGNPRSFVLLWQGEALPRHDVDIYSASGRHERLETNSDGQFEIGSDLSGAVLVSAVRITLPDEPSGIYHSDQATLAVTLR